METTETSEAAPTMAVRSVAIEKLHDLVIRNGMIIDGSGREGFLGDVAVTGGIITHVGRVGERGREEIDARKMLVTPGFVDIHTHYDAQTIWEETLVPSSDHGVTTVVIGNCGVGFAPCRKRDRQRLIDLMEGVEDIPDVVMAEGLTWEWESYPEYLEAIDRRRHDINIASYLPHAPLRVLVMGDRAAPGERSTAEDRKQMAELAEEAVRAGAIGFATSRSLFHKSASGDPICTLDFDEGELAAIAGGVRAGGDAIMQVAAEFGSEERVDADYAMLDRVARGVGIPMTLPIAEMHNKPNLWRRILGNKKQSNDKGGTISAQALPRGIGMLFGLDLSAHPFFLKPSYKKVASMPIERRLEGLRKSEVKAWIIQEKSDDHVLPVAQTLGLFDGMFEVEDPFDYEPEPSHSIAERARAEGVTPESLAYDILVAHGGQPAIYLPFANYAAGNLDTALEMFKDQYIVLGLGDGGAHYGIICDASYTTFLLTHWTRDRTRGEKLAVPEVVRAMTSETARVIGLADRGLIAPGFKADINVIDYENLRLGSPVLKFDLPEGGRRLKQPSRGYVATIVNGEIIARGGVSTGARPGVLIRGSRDQPSNRPEVRCEPA